MNLIPILVPLGGVLLGFAIMVSRWSLVLAVVGTVLFGVAFVLVLAGM